MMDYVHELGNILDAHLKPPTGPNDVNYERHYKGKFDDTGQNLENCIRGLCAAVF
jgi:hypothetical protein